jgi:hypothetical protein
METVCFFETLVATKPTMDIFTALGLPSEEPGQSAKATVL